MKIGNISIGEVLEIGVTQPNQFYYCGAYGGIPNALVQYNETYSYLQPDSIYQTMPSTEHLFIGQMQSYLSRRSIAKDFDTNTQYMSPGTSFGYGKKQDSENAPFDKITQDYQTTPEGDFFTYKNYSFFPNNTTRYNTFWHTSLYTELLSHNILVAENENIPVGGEISSIKGWIKGLFAGQNLGPVSNLYGTLPHRFVEGGLPFVKLRIPSNKTNGPGGPAIGTSENNFGYIDYYMLLHTYAHTGIEDASQTPNNNLYEMIPTQGDITQGVNDFLSLYVNQTSYSSELLNSFRNILQNNFYIVPTIIADFREPVYSIDWQDMMHGGEEAIIDFYTNPGTVYENMSLFAYPGQYNPNNENTKAPNYGWHPMSTENVTGKSYGELVTDYHLYIDSFAYIGTHPGFFTIDNLFLQDYDVLGLLPETDNPVMVQAAFNDYNFLEDTKTEILSILATEAEELSSFNRQKLLIMVGRIQFYQFYAPDVYNRPEGETSGPDFVNNNSYGFWTNSTFFPSINPSYHNNIPAWMNSQYYPHLYNSSHLIRMFGPIAPRGYVPKCGVNYSTYFNLGDEFVSGTAPTQYGNTNFTFRSGLSLGSIESVDSFLGYDASQLLSNIPAGFQLTEADAVNILDLELWKLFYDSQQYCKRIETKVDSILQDSFVQEEINSLSIPRIQYLSYQGPNSPEQDEIHIHPFMIGLNPDNPTSAIPVQWQFPDFHLNVPTEGGPYENYFSDAGIPGPPLGPPVGGGAAFAIQHNPELPEQLIDLQGGPGSSDWRIYRVRYIEPYSEEWNSLGPISHLEGHITEGSAQAFGLNLSNTQGYWIIEGVVRWYSHNNGVTGAYAPVAVNNQMDPNFGQIATSVSFNPDYNYFEDYDGNGEYSGDAFLYNAMLKQGEYYVFEQVPTTNSGFAAPFTWEGFDPQQIGEGYYDYTTISGAYPGGAYQGGSVNPDTAFVLRHPADFVLQWVKDNNILNSYEMERFEFCHQIGTILKTWNSETNPYVDYYYQHIVRFFNSYTRYYLENPLSGPDREYNPYLHGTDHPISTYFSTIRDFLTQLAHYNGGISAYEISNWVEWLRGGCTQHFDNSPPVLFTQYTNPDVVDEFGSFEMPTTQTIFREDGLGFFARVIFNKNVEFNNWWQMCEYLNQYENLQTGAINYITLNRNDNLGIQDDVLIYSDVPYVGSEGQFSIEKGYYPSNPESPFPSEFSKGSELFIYMNQDIGITTEAFGPAESPGFASGTSFVTMINELIQDGIEGQTIDIYPENTQGSGYYSREDGLLYLERSIRAGNPDYRVLQLIDFALQNNLMQQLAFLLPPTSSPSVQGDTPQLPSLSEDAFKLPIPTKALGVFDGKVSAAAIKYNIQPWFAEKEDRGFLKENEKNLHSNNLFTQSINPTNTEYYFTMTDGDPTLASSTTTFDVAFGHIGGSGSNGRNNSKGPSEAIYRQAANELLGNAEGAFFSLSQSLFDLGLIPNDLEQPAYMRTSNPTPDEYVWILRAHGYKQQESVFDPFIKFNLSGSNASNIGQTTQLRTDISKRIVQPNGLTRYFLRPTENASGSPYGNQKEGDGVFGYWYPEIGTAVFNPKIAEKHNANSSVISTQFDADRDFDKNHTGMKPNGLSLGIRDYRNALKLVNNFKNYDGNYIENAALKVNSNEAEQLNMIACIRLKTGQFNFTTNPTRFINLGTTGQYNTFPAAGTSTTPVNRETMKYDEGLGTSPTTYITHIDLYDILGYRVATAKLSTPIKKDFNSEVVIKILLKDY